MFLNFAHMCKRCLFYIPRNAWTNPWIPLKAKWLGIEIIKYVCKTFGYLYIVPWILKWRFCFVFFCIKFPYWGICPSVGLVAGWATVVCSFLQWADTAGSTRSDKYMEHGILLPNVLWNPQPTHIPPYKLSKFRTSGIWGNCNFTVVIGLSGVLAAHLLSHSGRGGCPDHCVTGSWVCWFLAEGMRGTFGFSLFYFFLLSGVLSHWTLIWLSLESPHMDSPWILFGIFLSNLLGILSESLWNLFGISLWNLVGIYRRISIREKCKNNKNSFT